MQDRRDSHLASEEVDLIKPPNKRLRRSVTDKDEQAKMDMRRSFDCSDNLLHKPTKSVHFEEVTPLKQKLAVVAEESAKTMENSIWSAFGSPAILDKLSDVVLILKRAEQKATGSSRLFLTSSKGMHDDTFKDDSEEGQVFWANKAVQNHFGVWPQSILGLSFLPFLFDQTDGVLFSDATSNCFSSKKSLSVTLNVALANGRRGTAKCEFSHHLVHKHPFGVEETAICIMKIVPEEETIAISPPFVPPEISPTKKSPESFIKCIERILVTDRTREEVLQNFFDESPLPIAVLDLVQYEKDVEIVWTNTALSQLIHLSVTQIIGSRMRRDLKFLNVEEWIASLEESSNNVKQTLFVLSFGEQSKISCTFKRISEFKYLFMGCLSETKTVERIIEKNHAAILEAAHISRKNQLNDALQVKSRFLAVMSHEIRTPLSGILGTLELISQTTLTSSQKELIQTAHLCGEQLLLVLSDILDFSQMAENKLSLDSVSFAVPALLEEAMEVVLFESTKKGIEIICDVDPRVERRCVGDVRRIRQILVNLLSNAVKFSSSGEIVVGIKSEPIDDKRSELQFYVKDQGIGILEEIKPFIFQPFMQADNSCTRKVGGSGLGLCISEQLCRMMGGKMWFKSNVGQGSTFYFNVVLTRTSDPEAQTVIESNSKRILVVDHSQSHSKALSNKLVFWGFYVRVVENVKHAHSLVSSQPKAFHLILIGPDQDETYVRNLQSLCSVVLVGTEMRGIESIKKPLKDRDLKVLLSRNMGEGSMIVKMAVPTKSPTLPKLSIMVAEDTLSNQMIIRKLLENLGFKDVVIVNNGKKALELAKVRTFDVILMDVMMPEMGGIEATERIRAEIPPSGQPCIIALTANAFEADKKQCIDSGMSCVVTKPIDRKALISALEHSLEWKNKFQDEAMQSLKNKLLI